MAHPRPRISCSTGTFYHLPLERSLALIRDAGYDGAEFAVSPESLARTTTAIERIVRRVGLPILSYHPPLYPFPGWPRNQKAGMLAVVEGARALGAEVAVIHAPKGYSLTTPRALQYVAGITAAREQAALYDVVIGFETTQCAHDGKPAMLFDDLTLFLDFARQHDLSVTFDTAHAGANGDDLVAVLERIGPRLRNIHLSDCRMETSRDGRPQPKTHLIPGDGNTGDIPAFLAALGSSGYGGLITLEVSPFALGLWPPATLSQRLIAMREYVEQRLAATAIAL